jgi:hypothetical protein
MAVDIADFIRQAALARGIDPNIALRVAQGEGGLSDPFRHGEGPAPRTQAPQFGPKENSYGPFQLYISGTGAGLGDKALAAGIDPRKNWQAGVDFALDNAKKNGWGQWYGAKANGITGMMGIGDNPSSAPVMGSPSVAAAAPQGASQASTSPPAGQSPQSVPPAVLAAANPTSGHASNPYAALLGSMMPQQQAIQPPRVLQQSPNSGNALLAFLAALKGTAV